MLALLAFRMSFYNETCCKTEAKNNSYLFLSRIQALQLELGIFENHILPVTINTLSIMHFNNTKNININLMYNNNV